MLLNLYYIKRFLLLLLIGVSFQVQAQDKILLLQEIGGQKITGIKEQASVKIEFKDASKQDLKGNLTILNKEQIKVSSDTISIQDIKEIIVPNVKLNNIGKKGLKASAIIAGVALTGIILSVTLDDLGSGILGIVGTVVAIPTALISLPLRLAKKRYKSSNYKISIVETP